IGDFQVRRLVGTRRPETPPGDAEGPARGPGVASLARIRARFEALVASLRRRRLAHRGYRELMLMSDHELADIGVGRGGIESATRLGRPAFGRVPGDGDAETRP